MQEPHTSFQSGGRWPHFRVVLEILNTPFGICTKPGLKILDVMTDGTWARLLALSVPIRESVLCLCDGYSCHKDHLYSHKAQSTASLSAFLRPSLVPR